MLHAFYRKTLLLSIGVTCVLEVTDSAKGMNIWNQDGEFENNTDLQLNRKQFRHITRKTQRSTFSVNPIYTRDSKFRAQDYPKSYERKKTTTKSGSSMRAKNTQNSRRIKNKYTRQDTDTHKSTRMTPAYLMQNENEAFKDTDSPKKEFISAYTINNDLEKLIPRFLDANITKEVLGRTTEYNDIILLKATDLKSETYFRADDDKFIEDTPEKKIIFIVHGLSVMGLQYLPCLSNVRHLKKLMSFYFKHLDKFDIFIIPLANPDGYSHIKNLMSTKWNKNMSPQEACRGVALDRNFDVSWNSSSPPSPCSQQFPGLAPFSEPESRAVRGILHRYSHKIVAYIHVHSGSYDPDVMKGDAVLYPPGFTDVQTDDDKYIDMRGEIDEAMKNASFEQITVHVNTLYNWYGGGVTGTSVDYASSVYGIPYAMEFSMQLYGAVNMYSDSIETEKVLLSEDALTEIWGRVIDVVFNSIWNNMHSNDI